jgi:hypothetical protein
METRKYNTIREVELKGGGLKSTTDERSTALNRNHKR